MGQVYQGYKQRFGPTNFEDLLEALTRLKQDMTIATYQEVFERLSHQVNGLLEIFLIGCFIEGLRNEILLMLKSNSPIPWQIQ